MSKLLEHLNEVQQQAVTYGPGPMLVLAGAGSGKTRVLTYRIAWLIEQGVEPQQILAITFTNKAANEMKERVMRLLGTTQREHLPQMGTFHATCVRILRRNSHHLGIPNVFSIYDETDSNALIKQVMDQLEISPKKFNPRAIKGTISNLKNELVTPDEYQQHAYGMYQTTVAKIYPHYQVLLRQNQALDFDDLQIVALELLTSNQSVRQYYQDRWEYVLVDEYQDTNPVQYELTKLFAGAQGNLNVVGDAAQSIYAFRGADLRNVNQFVEDFPNVKVFNLEQNYRSTQKILDTASKVIAPNRSAHPVLTLWTDNPAGEDLNLYEAANSSDEATYTVNQIMHQMADYDLSGCAILYRTNAQSRVFEEELIKAGVPYQIIGGVRFYDRREIKDLLAYLRLIENPVDTVSYQRIVNTPPRGIGPVTIKQGGPPLEKFMRMLDRFREERQKVDVLSLLALVIETVKYEDYILDGSDEGVARWENVQELRSVANEFVRYGVADSLPRFLESVSLLEQTDVAKDEQDQLWVGEQPARSQARVTLMTLHAAKGLEFPIVFLVGLEEGLLPHIRSIDEPFELEEERRLCYVGITRAMERLFISYARMRFSFGNFNANIPSRFLKELPMEHVQFQQAPGQYSQYANYEPDPLNPWE